MQCRCPASHTAINLLTGRKVDEAFKVYNALLKATEEGEAGAYKAGSQAEPMDTDTPVSFAHLSCLACCVSNNIQLLSHPSQQTQEVGIHSVQMMTLSVQIAAPLSHDLGHITVRRGPTTRVLSL